MWFSFFESSLGVGRKSYICDLISLINLENSRPLSLLVLFLPHFSLVAQMVKNLPAIQEAWVYSLGWEDILEKEMATHSSILAWRITWTIQSMGSQRVKHGWATFTFTCVLHQASLVVQMVKNLPAMMETWTQSLGWEEPLQKGMATHSSIFAWRISWTEERGRLHSMG